MAGTVIRQGTLWGLWLLHALVSALAVFSLALNGFSVWIDLPQLGWGLTALQWLWAASALAMPLLSGTWSKPRRGPPSPTAAAWTRRLLWPTYLLIACLLASTVRYFFLLTQDKVDAMLPMPLLVAAVLGVWAGLTWRWTRHPQSMSMTGWRSRFIGSVASGLLAVGVGSTLAFCRYSILFPQRAEAPIAVVLGGALKADGTASVELRYRVKAATDAFKSHQVSGIILSGAIWPATQPGGAERSELAAMRTVALSEGIPQDALIIDPVGVNTRATAFNTLEWMRTNGITSVLVCTSDYHLFRTVTCFNDYAGKGISIFMRAGDNPDWSCANPRAVLREIVGNITYSINPHYREPIAMQLQLKDPRVVVKKSAGTLDLYDGPTLRKTYTCITGRNAGDKAVEGDASTPVGAFHIVFKNPFSKFHLSLGLDYPTQEDADRGLAAGLITKQEHDDILTALASDLTKEENQKKLWYTKLGGEIFIHGHGEGRTGTAGCVALSNPDVEELYALLPLGTEVQILP